MIRFLVVFFALYCLPLNHVFAAMRGQATQLYSSQSWNTYRSADGIIYMSSAPIKESGTYYKREAPNLIIANFGGGKIEVSVYVGFTYNKNKTVAMSVAMSRKDPSNIKSFTLYPHGESAWSKDQFEDKMIIDALIMGDKVTIVSESHKGTTATDTYSLDGFTAAYKVVSAG